MTLFGGCQRRTGNCKSNGNPPFRKLRERMGHPPRKGWATRREGWATRREKGWVTRRAQRGMLLRLIDRIASLFVRLPLFHGSEKILRSRSPLGDGPNRLSKRNIQRMHTIRRKDVNRPGEGGRYGWDEDGEAPVLQLFNDEGWAKGIFNLSQCRLPGTVLSVPGQLLGETSKKSVAG
jgi:hypothetical protein